MSVSRREQWGDLTNNDYKPLINKVLSGAYPPGSTFKMVVALAALDAGVITPETTFSCTGAFRLGTQLSIAGSAAATAR